MPAPQPSLRSTLTLRRADARAARAQTGSLQSTFNGHIQALLVMVLACAFGVSISMLLFFHIYLLLTNQSTLGTAAGRRIERATRPLMLRACTETMNKARIRGREHRSERPFDRGFRQNFIGVFGPQPSLWLCPMNTSLGDGCAYEVAPGRVGDVEAALTGSSTAPAVVVVAAAGAPDAPDAPEARDAGPNGGGGDDGNSGDSAADVHPADAAERTRLLS